MKKKSQFTVNIGEPSIADGFGKLLIPPPVLVSNAQAAKHSQGSSAWGTPDYLVDKARNVLGGVIDFDPASSYEDNERIKASRFFDATEDALIQGWAPRNGKPCTVFMNAPGGSVKTLDLERTHRLPYPTPRTVRGTIPLYQSIPSIFWFRLMQLRKASVLKAAVVVAFNIEALQITQRLPSLGDEPCPAMCDFLVCVAKKRINYLLPTGKPGGSPTHASAFVYVGSERKLFMAQFEDVGTFMAGKLA